MAGPYTCCGYWSNLLPTGKDELAKDAPRAPTKSSDIRTRIFAVSRASTPALTPGSSDRYTDEDLQRATKLALESFAKSHKYGQANSALRERAFKACNPDLYYESSHMECSYFCRQCEDYFDTVGATGH